MENKNPNQQKQQPQNQKSQQKEQQQQAGQPQRNEQGNDRGNSRPDTSERQEKRNGNVANFTDPNVTGNPVAREGNQNKAKNDPNATPADEEIE